MRIVYTLHHTLNIINIVEETRRKLWLLALVTFTMHYYIKHIIIPQIRLNPAGQGDVAMKICVLHFSQNVPEMLYVILFLWQRKVSPEI